MLQIGITLRGARELVYRFPLRLTAGVFEFREVGENFVIHKALTLAQTDINTGNTKRLVIKGIVPASAEGVHCGFVVGITLGRAGTDVVGTDVGHIIRYRLLAQTTVDCLIEATKRRVFSGRIVADLEIVGFNTIG